MEHSLSSTYEQLFFTFFNGGILNSPLQQQKRSILDYAKWGSVAWMKWKNYDRGKILAEELGNSINEFSR